MLFNSIDFAIFLPMVFGLYWMIGSERIRIQNALLLLVSYFSMVGGIIVFWD